MIDIEDTLRAHYAATDDDLAAEQRLRQVIHSGRPSRARHANQQPDEAAGARGWLVAASAAGVVALAAGGLVAAGQAHTARVVRAAGSGAVPNTVTLTPQGAVRTLIGLLPAGGMASPVSGSDKTAPGAVGGSVTYTDATRTATLTVSVCYPLPDGTNPTSCPLPSAERFISRTGNSRSVSPLAVAVPVTVSILPDGAKLAVVPFPVLASVLSLTIGPDTKTGADVTLTRTDRVQVSLMEVIPAAQSSAPVLSISQLTAIVTSPDWRP
ncbi:MAG TPA: hypothetical protein VFN75_02170 [Pseudonocardiaceae bacterium]|nr:hypothetical protein [Pseudonocardiaceae bacterium]